MRLGSKRYFPHRRQKKITGAFLLLCLALGFTGVCCYIFHVVRPTFAALAENKARTLAIYNINQAVSDKIAQVNPQYDDVVELTHNSENSVTALKSNLSGISKLKSDLNLEIMHSLSGMETDTLKIPLGSLLGNDIFAGIGPMISFQVLPYGTAETDITTNFTEAGINQTMLDVSVKVKADISVLMPTMRKKSTVETTVPVMQTVIVGNTPDSYTHVDRDGRQFEDDVLELAD